ncbi:ATP-dependent RNA helicase HrpA [Salinibacterium hongtaonis]|uniref:ATP-dependent RNA helicase HrpA n=1 Tax=Homoserinimonas hongtaonis TaxID=2079791 RepID=A0A2U1T0B9_9MICO|nr:ATP-dependent RNA helicase HrpA [Salinibacterium hongtaonis]PWB97307.1 ATP-dependent RNA helicase HrpA [Salinibacterium hongtaonis]
MTPADAAIQIVYPPDLPVSQRRDDISAAIRDNQVVIVAGATGSGKTTQLPKMLLELGYQSIGHTQPRRIAARTIAERIAEELGQEVGELVGYQVRFTDRTAKGTRVKLMTDGILLNEIHRDRLLRKYDAIIIDEAHERSLTIDFLLGYLKQLLPKRPELKVIITSATIDPESFAQHFAAADGSPAPIVEVSGRTYPVEIRYRPLAPDAESDDPDDEASAPAAPAEGDALDLFDGINAAIDELGREGSGDILVFLSGENEIRDAEDAIRARNLPGVEVLPLYGRLSAADQHKVFQPSSVAGTRRRIVLATNVAETSLTVPGIKYVIDAGTARISRYSVRAKIQRLPIEAISQASANQRSGRSGRTSDGIAIRLYSEQDFEKRPEFTDPEILRTNLAAVILQMISLGLGAIEDFPFLQPPDSRGIKDGLDLLAELGAVERGGGAGTAPRITKIGRQLSQLPIDPRLARMVIESGKHGVSREVMAIVAGLSIQDPRERPLEKRPQADQLHARFADKTSDFLTLLNLWNHLKEKEKELSGGQFRRLCKAEYLNFLRVREWADVYRQLERMAKPLGLTIGEPSNDGPGIHRSIMAGLLSQLGVRDDTVADPSGKGSKDRDRPRNKKGDYIGARQVRFSIFPGSTLAKKQPAEIMSAELVETSRLFARMNAAVDLAWAEPLAGDLAKRSYGEPHWEKKQGSAVAYERVTLYGVPIVARRRVQLSRIDPAQARDLFIRHALVQGEWDSERLDKRLTAFERANRTLRDELADVEERTRRRNILVDDEAVYEFYDRRIPATVSTQRDFESWWKKTRAETPELLTMTRDDLLDHEDAPPELVESDFPKQWSQGDQRLALSYRFEPGSPDDGVTVRVPLALLARLSADGFDWQVPGFREQLATAMIKALPKAIRRNVVPAADWARRLLSTLPDDLDTTEMPFAEYLASQIQRQTYTPVDVDDFELERVPDHLLVTFAVIDDNGRELARSKDLASLQEKLKNRARESVARLHAQPQGGRGRGPAARPEGDARPADSRPGPRQGGAPSQSIERTGLTSWDLDVLPRVLDTRLGGNTVRAYPALVDQGTTVGIRLMSTPADQAREHRRGVRRLLALAIPAPLGYVQQHLTAAEKLSLGASPYRTTQALFEDCMVACLDAALDAHAAAASTADPVEAALAALPWTKADFERMRDAASSTIVDALFETVGLVAKTLAAAREAERAIKSASSMALIAPLADAREQLDALVYPGFAGATGRERLRRLPLYVGAITHRVSKLAENLGRDRVWMAEVQKATELYVKAGGQLPLPAESANDPAQANLVRARWMLEELRISLFAQHLGTAEPVSLQRIQKALGR